MSAPPITVSPGAATAFAAKLRARGTPCAAIRFGVRGGSCSGYSYVIEFEDASPRPRDAAWEADGVKFVADSKSLLFLSGSVVTWKKSLMAEGFSFQNPSELSKCGCGSSFAVK